MREYLIRKDVYVTDSGAEGETIAVTVDGETIGHIHVTPEGAVYAKGADGDSLGRFDDPLVGGAAGKMKGIYAAMCVIME